MNISIVPVAYVRNSRNDMSDDYWGGVISSIELAEGFSGDALSGIEEFSHLEIIFHFHKADPSGILYGAGHPRSNPSWPRTGIFAQRKKDRPNLIGSTIVRLLRREGNSIVVEGLDADDGTPVIDIKPVMKGFLPQGELRQPRWADELMREYWKVKGGTAPQETR